MKKRTYTRDWHPGFLRLLMLLLLITFSTVLACALLSYTPHDLSLCTYASFDCVTHNWLGFFGAQLAAFSIYFFGLVASWMLLTPLLYACCYVAFNARIRDEWDRTVAVLSMPFFATIILHRYGTGPYAGGLIGTVFSSVCAQWLPAFCSDYVLCTVASVLALLIFRPPIIRVCTAVVTLFVYLVRILSLSGSYIQPVYRSFATRCERMMQPFRFCARTVHQLFAGILDDHSHVIALDYDELKTYVHDGVVDSTWQSLAQDCAAPAAERAIDQTFQRPSQVVQESSPDAPAATASLTGHSYRLPSLTIFELENHKDAHDSRDAENQKKARILEEKLKRFDVHGNVVSIKQGPVVTLYHYRPAIDCKISKIISLEDDLALALQAHTIRIIAPIPGSAVVGFEVANAHRITVKLNTIIRSRDFAEFSGALPLILGEDAFGGHTIVDLAAMPHLLIAGSTGSGKSVALNGMLVSLLCSRTPHELRLILIDPKRLELAVYADIAHLLFPIVTDPKKTAPVLEWVVQEMERRYQLIATEGVRTSVDYNKRVATDRQLPRIVVVIDELADLMMTGGKQIEHLIVRIAQMARASGIHLLVATQRPSVDVITGLIKANFPSRISFRVTSKVDSRIILDTTGADKLLGRGDMLFLDSAAAQMRRVHGAYVSDTEIQDLVNHIKAEAHVSYLSLADYSTSTSAVDDADRELIEKVEAFLHEVDQISISLVQRTFRIGYNRSARIIEILEQQGRIASSNGSKMRRVIRE